MKIKDVMTRDPRRIAPDASVRQAARLMRKHGVGILPVCSSSGRLMGMLTDRDLVVRALAPARDPDTTRVSDVMSRDPAWCREDEDLESAAQVMESRRVRRVPVLDRRGHLIGLLSIDDIARPAGRRDLAGDVLEESAARRPAPRRRVKEGIC